MILHLLERSIPLKTEEELKEEVETVSKKLHELTEDELKQVSGGGKLVITYIDENGQECSHTSGLSQRSAIVDWAFAPLYKNPASEILASAAERKSPAVFCFQSSIYRGCIIERQGLQNLHPMKSNRTIGSKPSFMGTDSSQCLYNSNRFLSNVICSLVP